MKFAARKPADLGMNLTSMIDVMLVMLLFFMVTTTFERQRGLKVKLPEADPAEQAVQEQRIELIISRDGRFFIGPNEVVNAEIGTLKAALERAANGSASPGITIRADARTEHANVVRAMDAAGQLGFANLTIATTESKR
jgi:biopolymer transport protein ExbD